MIIGAAAGNIIAAIITAQARTKAPNAARTSLPRPSRWRPCSQHRHGHAVHLAHSGRSRALRDTGRLTGDYPHRHVHRGGLIDRQRPGPGSHHGEDCQEDQLVATQATQSAETWLATIRSRSVHWTRTWRDRRPYVALHGPAKGAHEAGVALDDAQVGVSKLAAEGASRLDRGSELKGRKQLSAIHERRSPARVDAGIGDEPADIAKDDLRLVAPLHRVRELSSSAATARTPAPPLPTDRPADP